MEKTKTIAWYCEILKAIVMPPFNAVANPATDAVLGPINDAIPDPMKQFIDIQQLFSDMVESIIDACIEKVVSSGQE